MWTEQMGSSREEDMDPHSVWPTFLLCALGTAGPQGPGGDGRLQVCGLPRPLGARAAPRASLTELPVVRGERRPRAPTPSTSLLVVRASSPLNSRNRWPALVGVEVVWSAEVVRNSGVRAAPIRGPCSPGCPGRPLSGPCSGPLLYSCRLSDIGPM